MSDETNRGARKVWTSVFVGITLFTCLGGVLLWYLQHLPEMKEEDKGLLKSFPPKSLGQLTAQRDVLLRYADLHPVHVLSGLCMMYLYMQTFAIPGTLTLSILAGAIYGSYKGLFLVTVVSTAGSTCCYGLSRTIGRGLAQAFWPEKVEAFGREVQKRKDDMLSYIVFLRVTPILPNTFINVASPVVQVPLPPFIAGTFFGCIPNNFIAVKTGSKLGELNSLTELYDAKQLLFGLGIGLVALLPIYWKSRAEVSSEGQPASLRKEQ